MTQVRRLGSFLQDGLVWVREGHTGRIWQLGERVGVRKTSQRPPSFRARVSSPRLLLFSHSGNAEWPESGANCPAQNSPREEELSAGVKPVYLVPIPTLGVGSI